ERPKTLAERKYEDDVDEETKSSRLSEIIALQQKHSLELHRQRIGQICEVLIEGVSKRSADALFGRNTQNSVVIFPKGKLKAGNYVYVKITDCTSATLIGEVV
ncbi:MAG TPA: TRAM domain-containing protein, partial [Flavobacteriales bacterium]|nr:TRAM domain-containing protein [Flavobacteriales bacterium]